MSCSIPRPSAQAFARLNLCRRAVNALLQAGIATPEEAAAMRESDLLALRCFGPASLKVLKDAVPARTDRSDR